MRTHFFSTLIQSYSKIIWKNEKIPHNHIKIFIYDGMLIDNIQYTYLNSHLLCSGPNMFTELSHYELTYSVVASLMSGKINS